MPTDIIDRRRPGPTSEYGEQKYFNFAETEYRPPSSDNGDSASKLDFSQVDYEGNHAPAGTHFEYAPAHLDDEDE